MYDCLKKKIQDKTITDSWILSLIKQHEAVTAKVQPLVRTHLVLVSAFASLG